MRDKVEEVMEHVIRPALQSHGCDLELIDVTEGVVKVKFKVASLGCPISHVGLKVEVERVLTEHIPEVKEVIAVCPVPGSSSYQKS